MRKVLLVIPSLEYGGAARQLTLLAAHLTRDDFEPRICVLGGPAPWVEDLRAAHIDVDVLGWKRPFDVRPFLALRALVRAFRPDVLHAWGRTALWALALSGSSSPGRMLVSAAVPSWKPPSALDAWLLRQAGGVLALGAAEAGRYREIGVPGERLVVLDPAADPAQIRGKETAALDGLGELPPDGRVVLGIGPLEMHKGFHDAVWALDILHYLYDNLHLVLAGDGSDRPRVEAFARGRARVHFTGTLAKLGPLLRRAEVVWVPSLRGGGVCAALEAMAAGKPVIASRCPDLAEVVADGVTGFLVEPGDRVALARQTRALLDDPGRRQRWGAAGRERVAERFTAERLAEGVARVYQDGFPA